jgi:hypothetical protein
MVIFKFIFSSQRFLVKTRRIYASIAGLLQVNSTQLALKIAARDRFIIQSSGYLLLAVLVLGMTFYLQYAAFNIKF